MSNSEFADHLNGTGGAGDGAGDGAEPRASVIPEELVITGVVKCRGELEVFGLIDGDVDAARLVVGESGRITGDVLADSVTINGEVVGSISCRNLMIEAEGAVNGDITSELLSVKRGAQLRGASAVAGSPRPCENDPQSAGAPDEEPFG